MIYSKAKFKSLVEGDRICLTTEYHMINVVVSSIDLEEKLIHTTLGAVLHKNDYLNIYKES